MLNRLIPVLFLSTACAAGSLVTDEIVPDFTLIDSNQNSSQYEKEVSPRDYIGSISGWYFGHGT